MPEPRSLIALAVVLVLAVAAGCGSDDKTPADQITAPAGSSSSANGDETDTASGGLIDICTQVSEAEIAAILGSPVTSEAVPGGGCTYSQEDVRAAGISLASSAYDEGTGGFDAAVSGVSGTIEGTAGGPVDGVGDEAYVKTGTVFGGSSQQGGGVVHVGANLFQVTLTQAKGLSAAAVNALVVDALKLAATKG
jgi:hypothetical protein